MNSLKLKPIEVQAFSIYSFGKVKHKQTTSPVVELIIKSKVSKDMKIKTTVIVQRTVDFYAPICNNYPNL